MNIERISKNKLKETALLKQKKYRQLRNEVLVEGLRSIKQLHESRIKFKYLMVCKELLPEVRNMSAENVYLLEKWQFNKITSTKSPQSIAAVMAGITPDFEDNGFRLYLDGVKEPGNMGTIFRTAAAAGISGILLSSDCCEIFNPKVVRSSLGTVFTMPSKIIDQAELFSYKAQIIVSVMNVGDNIFEYKKSTENSILVMGSEAFGINKELIEKADVKLTIPLCNQVESLNVGIAMAILSFNLAHNNTGK